MGRPIDYYFSLQSPWAYIGNAPFHKVASSHKLEVNYKPVLLGDLFSETGGQPLAKRHPARQRYRVVELQRWRDKRGLKFHLKPQHWPFNGRLADGLVIAAAKTGHDVAPLLERMYAAVWENQLDLADASTLTKLADEAGLSGDHLVKQAGSDEVGAIYEKNRQDAIGAGVFGSPAYVLDGEVFWGQDRIELLADALSSGRAAFGTDP